MEIQITLLIITIALAAAVTIARIFPIIGETLILGGFFLLIEGYKFYLQPALNLPLLPLWFILFVGTYIVFSALLIVGRFIPFISPFVVIIAGH